MKRAQELIQEKRYDEARAILKTVDHPKARDWLAKLDKIAPRKSTWRKFKPFVYLAILCVLLVVGYTAYSSFQQTQEAARQMMNLAVEQNTVRSHLKIYCQEVIDRSETECDEWVSSVVGDQYEGAKYCADSYDWIRQTEEFSNCLLSRGINPLGSEIIQPVQFASLTDADYQLIASLALFCQGSGYSDDYCNIWRFFAYSEHRAEVISCNQQSSVITQISAYENCLRSNGVVPEAAQSQAEKSPG